LKSKLYQQLMVLVYDEDVIMHTGKHDFAPGVKVKSQDLMLRPRVLHKSITHNILSKRRHYNEVRFTIMC
jgi:hypothetical protein